ncbi:hypothetical protein BDZ85DRAFT_316201 [Elsinoe ampelina]|uniref:Uncharacterized protein n=1 Tax=Elsinoe ampelina TaxID=302913 RepID=A0A6A6GLU3_9PEZI|nr:hypothetical protein BDZ85DRAFT_316201 [Elsinoe ampelina]
MLLRQRHLSLVEFLIESHPQVLTWVDPARQTSNFHLLVSLGFSEVLQNVADHVTDAIKHNHRASEPHDPSLPSVTRDKPLLFTAVQRELSNIEVVRFLVETTQVDINEVYDYVPDLDELGYPTYADDEENIQDAPTVLHYVSRGKYWWHAGQCLPYLLKRPDIDVEARNKYGQTPLLLALSYNNMHSEACSRRLIESGANVKAVDNHGKTCLALAEGRTELPYKSGDDARMTYSISILASMYHAIVLSILAISTWLTHAQTTGHNLQTRTSSSAPSGSGSGHPPQIFQQVKPSPAKGTKPVIHHDFDDEVRRFKCYEPPDPVTQVRTEDLALEDECTNKGLCGCNNSQVFTCAVEGFKQKCASCKCDPPAYSSSGQSGPAPPSSAPPPYKPFRRTR